MFVTVLIHHIVILLLGPTLTSITVINELMGPRCTRYCQLYYPAAIVPHEVIHRKKRICRAIGCVISAELLDIIYIALFSIIYIEVVQAVFEAGRSDQRLAIVSRHSH